MKHYRTRSFAGLMLIAISSTAICAQVQSPDLLELVPPASVGFDATKLKEISTTVSQWVADKRVVGANAMVIRNGRLAFYDQWGLRDRDKSLPITRDTIFRIYSMSKPITSVAVMQQVERGNLAMDDPISNYLPAFKDMRVIADDASDDENADESKMKLKTVRARREITVRDLLSHTSGLTYGFFGNTVVDKEYRAKGVLIMEPNLESLVEKLGNIPLLYQPGTRFHYSVSSDVLGRLVEVTSGVAFDEYLRKNIFEPLGMDDTGFFVPQDDQPRFAEMYRPTRKGLVPAKKWESLRMLSPENKFFSGGGGLCSTIDDYARFAQMLAGRGQLESVQLLEQKTVEEMFTNQLDRADLSSGGFQFGLGFRIGDRKKHGKDYGWGGAAGTRFWTNPDQNLVILFMTQLKPSSNKLGEEVRDLVYGALVDG